MLQMGLFHSDEYTQRAHGPVGGWIFLENCILKISCMNVSLRGSRHVRFFVSFFVFLFFFA